MPKKYLARKFKFFEWVSLRNHSSILIFQFSIINHMVKFRGCGLKQWLIVFTFQLSRVEFILQHSTDISLASLFIFTEISSHESDSLSVFNLHYLHCEKTKRAKSHAKRGSLAKNEKFFSFLLLGVALNIHCW